MENYVRCTFERYCKGIFYKKIDENKIEKKAEYIEVNFSKIGHIIGECIKYEGEYKQGHIGGNSLLDPDYGDHEPSALINRKAIHFYHVLIGYNEIILVNKDDTKY